MVWIFIASNFVYALVRIMSVTLVKEVRIMSVTVIRQCERYMWVFGTGVIMRPFQSQKKFNAFIEMVRIINSRRDFHDILRVSHQKQEGTLK